MSPTVDGQIVSQRTISDLALDSLNNSTISHTAKTMAALQNSLIIMALSERYLMPRSIGRLLREAALQLRAGEDGLPEEEPLTRGPRGAPIRLATEATGGGSLPAHPH
jgi:hypothetical protein